MLKYPLVLVHGIAAHDRKSIIDFWGRIPEVLKGEGVELYYGNTDSWGGYESNAELLKSTIEKILKETHKEKVNILAHSKGGIDSRYLIWKYNLGSKVASLSTISTPHHGAEISDLIDRQEIIHSKLAKRVLDAIGKLYGDKNPDMYKVNHQLTTENMRRFNEKVIMDAGVYYQSIYTSMNTFLSNIPLMKKFLLKNYFDMFFYTHEYIKSISGKNDGMVSEKSARWGDNIIEIKGRISHSEILDLKKKKISGMDIPSIYVNIVRELEKKGF
jgi:triacylglycerol lipase